MRNSLISCSLFCASIKTISFYLFKDILSGFQGVYSFLYSCHGIFVISLNAYALIKNLLFSFAVMWKGVERFFASCARRLSFELK